MIFEYVLLDIRLDNNSLKSLKTLFSLKHYRFWNLYHEYYFYRFEKNYGIFFLDIEFFFNKFVIKKILSI